MADLNGANGRRILARGTADLDGDGRDELITVTGIPVSEGGFSRDMVLMIRNGFSGRTTSVRPPQSEGYAPQLVFPNLTGGPGDDILLVIPTGGSGGIVNAYAYTYRRGATSLIFSSDEYDQEYKYTVAYQNGYKVAVTSLNNRLTYLIDISQRGSDYLDAIYNPDGTLKQPIEGWVDPIGGIFPVDFDGNGVYELLILQQISGQYHADGLGSVQNVLAWSPPGFSLESQDVAIFGFEGKGNS